jgi:hypothetical protein
MPDNNTEKADRLAEYDRLALAMGRFILSFGQIEGLTDMAIGQLCDEPLLRQIASRDWNFEKRRALLLELTRKRVVPEELGARWNDAWKRAQQIEQDRNHVAHGLVADGEISSAARLLLGHMPGLSPKAPLSGTELGVFSIKNLFGGKREVMKALEEVDELAGRASTLGKELGLLLIEVIGCPWRNRLVPEKGTGP